MKYYLATNETDIFHFGKMEEESVLTTGQPKVFYFDTEQKLINKLIQLTGDPNYYQNYQLKKEPPSLPSNLEN